MLNYIKLKNIIDFLASEISISLSELRYNTKINSEVLIVKLKELIKKIIDETDLRKQYNPDVVYNLKVPEKIYQKNLQKIKFKKTSIFTSCCYEFLYDDETREKCINKINELNLSEKFKNEPVAVMSISIKKKLHTKMKNEAKKIGTSISNLYEKIWYLYLSQKINFKLLKVEFLNLNSI